MPYFSRHSAEFARYVDAMRAIDLSTLQSRSDADAALVEAVPDQTVRGFLLQNLRREGDGWTWQPNLELIGAELDDISGWPADALDGASYDGPVLWIGGSESRYVRDEHGGEMERLFPRVRRVVVKQEELLHIGRDRQLHHIIHTAVSPADMLVVLRAVVLCIDDQYIRIANKIGESPLKPARH